MIKTTIPEFRRGSAKAEFVPAYQPARGSLFAVHRVGGQSTCWTVSLAHTPGPAGSLIPPAFPRRRDDLVSLIAHVEAQCPEAVAVWRAMDGVEAMKFGLSPAQAAAGRDFQNAATRYANELAAV